MTAIDFGVRDPGRASTAMGVARTPPTVARAAGRRVRLFLPLLIALVLPAAASAQDRPEAPTRPEDTEVWEPVPPSVVPGEAGGPAPIPSDAIVLFDGRALDEWENTSDGAAAGWSVRNSVVTVDKSVGHIQTRRRFTSYQLHLEWRVPEHITGEGQARGNSGLYLAWDNERREGYEVQILDSYGNDTYVNGMAGSVYKQSIPLSNPSRPPGEWQSYDVVWTAPTFDGDGTLRAPARVTVLFNGVLVQNDVALSGETVYVGTPAYHPHGPLPIMLQAHGDPSPPISFRNIWVRPLS